MTIRNELLPLLHQIGIVRAVRLYKTDGTVIVSQMHSNRYHNWSYLDNYLPHGHVILYPDGHTNHVLVYKWENYDDNT
jgi:hypothetical protein